MGSRFVLKHSVVAETGGTAGPIYQETVLTVLLLNNPLVLKRKEVQVSELIMGVQSQGRGR